MNESAIKFILKKPEHGWVPVKIYYKDKYIEFDASDVPNNPIEDLINAIFTITNGGSADVWWHLEPAAYHFNFELKNNELSLEVALAESLFAKIKNIELSISGSIQEILLPIYRGIEAFTTYEATEPHWPSSYINKIDGMEEIIKNA